VSQEIEANASTAELQMTEPALKDQVGDRHLNTYDDYSPWWLAAHFGVGKMPATIRLTKLGAITCKSLNLTLQAVSSDQYLSDTTKPHLAEYQFHRRTFLWN
jgi:Zn-dependent peptidase ImmA (M78 family)